MRLLHAPTRNDGSAALLSSSGERITHLLPPCGHVALDAVVSVHCWRTLERAGAVSGLDREARVVIVRLKRTVYRRLGERRPLGLAA